MSSSYEYLYVEFRARLNFNASQWQFWLIGLNFNELGELIRLR